MGCGRRTAKAGLVRLVVADGRLARDPEQRLPGRGAYVCQAPGCWERARARGALPRSFRRPVRIPEDALDLEI